MSRRPLVVAAVALVALPLAGCKSNPPEPLADETANIKAGAAAFSRNCAMCHTMGVIGSEGSATKIKDRERVDGPNFDVRRETRDAVLYAIRNGGFSGAIMPENIVVGREAEQVADFLAKYAGRGGEETSEPQSNPGQQDQLTGG